MRSELSRYLHEEFSGQRNRMQRLWGMACWGQKRGECLVKSDNVDQLGDVAGPLSSNNFGFYSESGEKLLGNSRQNCASCV